MTHFEFTVRTADTGEAIAQFLVPIKGAPGTPDSQTFTAGTFIQAVPDGKDSKLHGQSLDLSDIGNPTQSFEKSDDLDRIEERALAELRAAYPDTDVEVVRGTLEK